MVIYILSTQPEIGQIIQDHLTSEQNLCFLFQNISQLAGNLEGLKKSPDLLILDYTLFNHDLFSIKDYLNNLDIKLPCIFYNDPCITKYSRTKHWLSQIKLLQEIELNNREKEYEELLLSLTNLIESKELSPYINLMQKPLPLPNYLKKEKLNLTNIKRKTDDNIYDFKEKVSLPNNLFYLLKILQQNKNIKMTTADIQELYKNDNKNISEASIKVLISNLKKEIEKDPSCNFRICNERGLFSFLKISDV